MSRAHDNSLTRRQLLRVGSLGTAGLSLPGLLAGRHASAGTATATGRPMRTFGRAKRCILLFLTGGPPQHDTWDPKPEAPAEIRGEFAPIPTNVPGIRFTELFPKLAKQADKFCVVRSITHDDTVHTSAGYTMLTGYRHPLANAKTAADIRPRSDDFPHLGAIVAYAKPAIRGIPPFVALPEVLVDDVVNVYPGQAGGLLGLRYDPLLVLGNAQTARFTPPEVRDPVVGEMRLERRRALLGDANNAFPRVGGDALQVDGLYERAFDLIGSQRTREAFELGRESTATSERYGNHLFAQGCLMARRLAEAGVPLVTVYWHYEGPKDCPVWDIHCHNFKYLRERLAPPTDQALAAFFADMHDRGLLEDTLVVCMGEFGRTPKINAAAGRDHWPHAQTILMAGAGTPSGTVFGSTDAHGAYPDEHPITPPDLAATILHRLGVRHDLELRDRLDRPFLACTGTPVAGLG